MNKNYELCGGKLDDGACPLCGEARVVSPGLYEKPSPDGSGLVGMAEDAALNLANRRHHFVISAASAELTDAQLDGVVGGMAVLGGIGIALSLFRIAQTARLRRELTRR